MRRMRFVVIGSLFLGCSLLGKYDQDGQPCDKNEPNPALSCLSDAGYTCVNGFCKMGTVGLVDAGPTDGGKDGGNLGG